MIADAPIPGPRAPLVLRTLQVLAFLVVASIAGLALWPGAMDVARGALATASVERYREAIEFAAHESGVDPNLIAGMMRAESSGLAGAISHKGAHGLLQLMPATAVERAQVLGLEEPEPEDLLEDPLLNIRLGANYIAYLIRRSDGNVERALVAYNTGPTRLGRWIREAGSYDAWRAERRAAGNSDVLAFADRVQRYRDDFAARGVFEPKDDAETPSPQDP